MKKVRIYDNLEALPDSYLQLFDAEKTSSSFFASLPWFQNLFLNSLSKDHTIRLYGLEENGSARLLLPLCFIPRKNAWYLPRKLLAASNYYTSLFTLIQNGSIENCQENINLLINAVINEKTRWDSIDLHPMAIDSEQFNAIQHACRSAGMAVQTYFCFGNWYLDVNGRSFHEYFDSLPSRLKNTLQRKYRSLAKRGDLEIKLIQTEDQLDAAIIAYEQVYHSSWKLPEAHPLFIAGLMRTCAQHGWLRLGVAYIADQPVAAQLWIVHKQIASIYKLAYDDRYANLSVGSILTSHMMQHVIDTDHVKEVDYLTGDDAYKQDWMSHRRGRWGLIAFNLHSMYGVLGAFWHIGRRLLKMKWFSIIKKITK